MKKIKNFGLMLLTVTCSLVGLGSVVKAEMGTVYVKVGSPANNTKLEKNVNDISINAELLSSGQDIEKIYTITLVDMPTADYRLALDYFKENKNVLAKLNADFTTQNKLTLTAKNANLLFTGSNYIYSFVQGESKFETFYTLTPIHYIVGMGNLSPLYRFWSNEKQGHFYTPNDAEKDVLLKTDFSWKFEGTAYYIQKPNSSNNCEGTGKSAVYRFWNATVQHHFYTMNAAEKDDLISNNKAWAYEGVGFCADKTQVSETKPVYRFYSALKGGHFYTINEAEKNALIKNDPSWDYEDIAYYAKP